MPDRHSASRHGASSGGLLADAFRRSTAWLTDESPRESRALERALTRLERSTQAGPLLALARRVAMLPNPSVQNHPDSVVFLGLLAEALPNEPRPALALALALAAVQAPKAEQALVSVEERFGTDARASLALGRVRLEKGAPHEALVSFERALARPEQAAEALFGQGLAWLALSEPARAAQAFAAARALAPGDGTVAFHLALALGRTGDRDAALAVLDALLAREPDHAKAWFERGNLLQDAGRHGEAAAAFGHALAANPTSSSAAFNLALSLLAERRLDAALDAFGRAIRLDADAIGPVAQALAREPAGCLWLDPRAMARQLSARLAGP